jgi:hypothetical protein
VCVCVCVCVCELKEASVWYSVGRKVVMTFCKFMHVISRG